MAEKITPRSEDFSKWYQDIVIQAKLADYSPVKGCMVIRPNGYSIWEKIQKDLDRRIQEVGVKNAYFPLFIPESFLKKEAEHVEGFAPECAVVTHAGGKELEEKLIVRPTSETIINSMLSKWVQSYRDLPMKLNQWANVVRWEMRTRLFLRTTEFLWQEGHTCHATAEESQQDARRMLEVYRSFAEEILAMPVIPGRKSKSEQFAGAIQTYCIEAMMQDKKALQAGTSHDLSTNFAKAFDTGFLDKNGVRKLVHQASWGVSTRLIGGVIMTHSDDKGLVLPPKLASIQVVIIPILSNSLARPLVLEAAHRIASELRSSDISVLVDTDETKQPGWKFHEYELIGIPIRIEIGPKDLEKDHVVMTRRDLGVKTFIPMPLIVDSAKKQLLQMQSDMLEKARNYRDSNMHRANNYEELKKLLDEPGGFVIASWDQSAEIEKKIKEETKATIRCLPFDENYNLISEPGEALISKKTDGNVRAIFARSY